MGSKFKNQNQGEFYAVSAIAYFRKTHCFFSVWIVNTVTLDF